MEEIEIIKAQLAVISVWMEITANKQSRFL